MNSKEIGDAYENYIKNYIKKDYDIVYLWKDVPEKILLENNIFEKGDAVTIPRYDVGIDIVAVKNEVPTFIQCKNYRENSICVADTAGYHFFKSSFPNLKYALYYSGKLSSRLNMW